MLEALIHSSIASKQLALTKSYCHACMPWLYSTHDVTFKWLAGKALVHITVINIFFVVLESGIFYLLGS